jgi:hypothetical protein
MALRRTAKHGFNAKRINCAHSISKTTIAVHPSRGGMLVKYSPSLLAKMTTYLSDNEHWTTGERNYLVWSNEGIFTLANREKIEAMERIAGKDNIKWEDKELALLRLHHPHAPPGACLGKMLQIVNNESEIVGMLRWPNGTSIFIKEANLTNAYSKLSNEIENAKREEKARG